MNEFRVSSWAELNDSVFRGSWMPDIKRFRSQFAFRGLNLADYDLKTSLYRLGGNYHELERHLLRNFRKYAHRDVVEHDSIWHWLTMAKHHGLPTRVLDWTFSPLVAMHFAVSNTDEFQEDGAIWCVNYAEVHKLLPDDLRGQLGEEGSDLFTVEMLERSFDTLEEFDNHSETDIVLFFEPPSIDDRIVNQFALFSIISNPTQSMDEWLVDHPDCYFKIVIPADLKWEVRDKLDQVNITERVLFPGLDGLSRWLTRHYSGKN